MAVFLKICVYLFYSISLIQVLIALTKFGCASKAFLPASQTFTRQVSTTRALDIQPVVSWDAIAVMLLIQLALSGGQDFGVSAQSNAAHPTIIFKK
ncbi:hypothetical protein [Nostoc sp.]